MTKQVHELSSQNEQECIISLLNLQVAEMRRQNKALEQNNQLLMDLLSAQKRSNSPWMTQEEAANELGIPTKRRRNYVAILNHLHDIGRLPTVQGTNKRLFCRKEVKALSERILEGKVTIPTYSQLTQ